MATPYEDIYSNFISKITDQDLMNYLEEDRLEMLKNLMNSACTQFKTCRQDLNSRDEADENFIDTLNSDVIEIISELMLAEWVKPKLYITENFKNVMNTKDFNQFSPANLLKEIRETYISAKNNARSMMIDYSYRNE